MVESVQNTSGMKFGGGGREGGREIGGVARMVERLLLTPQPSREPKKVLPIKFVNRWYFLVDVEFAKNFPCRDLNPGLVGENHIS